MDRTLRSQISDIKKDIRVYLSRVKREINTNVWTDHREILIRNIDKKRWNKKEIAQETYKTIEKMHNKYKSDKDLVDGIVNKNEQFLKEFEENINNPLVRDVHRMYREVTSIHYRRLGNYLKLSDSESLKLKKSDKDLFIKLDSELQLDYSKLREVLNKLDLGEEDPTAHIEFRGKRVCPLIMHPFIIKKYPEVKEKLDKMGIDFESNPENKMLIQYNEEEIPFWDPTRHYWNQSKEALQFFVDEFKKMRNGIMLGDEFIHPWLYVHLNVSKFNLPTERENPVTGEKEVVTEMKNPPLRDNEWWVIQDNFRNASKSGVNKMMAVVASRRVAKTTMLISKYATAIYSGKKVNVLAGSNSGDLSQVTRGFLTLCSEVHPAFDIPLEGKTNTNDEIQIVIKTKDQKNVGDQFIAIVNTDGGSKKSSEKLAGFSMEEFNWDEFMKSPYLETLRGAEPAYKSSLGYRTTPMFTGTGGNSELSQDALLMLNNLEENDVYKMDWELFESRIPKEEITWQRREFSTFVPAQMAEETNLVKDETTLDVYLGRKGDKALKEIPIKVTNWEKANKHFDSEVQKRKGDSDSLRKYKVYYPRDPGDIFLSGDNNPYPADIIRHLRLEAEKNPKGQKVFLSVNKEGEISQSPSNKEYIKFPFSGGTYNAPVTIWEQPVNNPPEDFYTAGLDDVQQEEASTTDSVRAFIVWRRDTRKVVASLFTRPSDEKEAYNQMHALLKLYNTQVFMENVNMGFKSYLDGIGPDMADLYIMRSVNFLGDVEIQGAKTRSYGYSPTKFNNNYLHSITFKKMNEELKTVDEEGEVFTTRVYANQDDPRVLNELEMYSPSRNLDGYDALRGAIAMDHYLTYNNIFPQLETEEDRQQRYRERMMRTQYNKTRRTAGNLSVRSSQFGKRRERRIRKTI